MSDDRLKEALLSKLPAHRVTTFDEFGQHCEMIIASVLVGDQTISVNQRDGKKPTIIKAVDVAYIYHV